MVEQLLSYIWQIESLLCALFLQVIPTLDQYCHSLFGLRFCKAANDLLQHSQKSLLGVEDLIKYLKTSSNGGRK